MRVLVGLENNLAGRSLAWALDFPGCFASGGEEAEALLNLPRALVNHAARVAERSPRPWLELGDFDVRLAETWSCYRIDEDYELSEQGHEIRAWFRHDWKPLTAVEMRRGLEVLRWGRADLLELVGGLPPERLEREPIAGILRRAADDEWAALEGLAPSGPGRVLPADALERLAYTRARLEAVLPGLAGREQVVGLGGEFWSPRKLLRRAAWRELDAVGRIARWMVEGEEKT